MDFSDHSPNRVLARGVQITEFGDNQVNPEPIPLDESDLLLHQYLSPRKLCLLGGADDLEDINSLELKVDTSEMSLGNFGSLVPNLTELKLSNSTIHSIRDLGSCLHGLKILWMSQCSLQDLDGIGSLSNVQELYLSFNEISEISSVSMLENLEILDLEGNKIDCLSQIQYLAFCTKLTVLTLEGNPVCVNPSPESGTEEYNYRLSVRDAIPQLEYLDDEPLSNENCKKNVNVFDDDWAYMEKLQQDVSLQEALVTNNNEEDEEEGKSGYQSFISAFRPATSFKPGSALRPFSAMRPVSCRTRPQTSASKKEPLRPFSALAAVETDDVCHIPDSISELTDGSVVCGNPSRALLSRNKNKTAPSGNQKRLFPQYSFAPEHTYEPLPNMNENLTDVLEQLQKWKVQHEKHRKQIEASWAPQVLKIEPGDYVEESDEERDLDDTDDDIFSWETGTTSLNTKSHGFENEILNQEPAKNKSKEQSHSYDHDELVYPVSPSKIDDDVMNSKSAIFVKPSPPSRPPHLPPFACRTKMFKSQALKPDQSVCSSVVLNTKQPIIKELISSNGRRSSSDTKAFPRSFSARAAMNIPHTPSLLPSLPNLKTKSSSQKTT